MNTLLDPTLLFISEADWLDENKQNTFLDTLLNHLDKIDSYELSKIFWTDELQSILVNQPNIHPWFQTDLKNPLIAAIHYKFYSRTEDFIEHTTSSTTLPELSKTYNEQGVHEHFLKLAHALIEFDTEFYFCTSEANKLSPPAQYSFLCTCHTQATPKLINCPTDWLLEIDVARDYFPSDIEDFDETIKKAMEIIRVRDFANREFIYDFEFSITFKRSIIKRTTHRTEILYSIVKKLLLSRIESTASDLNDEFITSNSINEWRIRVTQRPTSTRIHYVIKSKNKVRFLKYYGEGEHDDGL